MQVTEIQRNYNVTGWLTGFVAVAVARRCTVVAAASQLRLSRTAIASQSQLWTTRSWTPTKRDSEVRNRTLLIHVFHLAVSITCSVFISLKMKLSGKYIYEVQCVSSKLSRWLCSALQFVFTVKWTYLHCSHIRQDCSSRPPGRSSQPKTCVPRP